ncbi:MAG TPA: hypothetical protein VM029_20675 [Opitutaceae bacterium]|nr:hypothetical protein [Opitutaceae bacterium]
MPAPVPDRSMFALLAMCVLPVLPCFAAQPPSHGSAAAAGVWQRHVARSHAVMSSLNQADPAELPLPPAGVTDLSFAELFGPIGDRGLEYSAKIRALEGQPVRLVGYMIRDQERAPGMFRLAAWPLAIDAKSPCGMDNAPPSAVHVLLPSAARPSPYRPGRLVLVGRVELGPRAEADGRNSTVRLVLEAAATP